VTRFKSKRNSVYLSDGTVKKTVSDAAAANLEAEYLCKLKADNVAVPEVLDVVENTLCLQYIPGDTLPDFLAKNPSEAELTAAAEGLAAWFADFYQITNNDVISTKASNASEAEKSQHLSHSPSASQPPLYLRGEFSAFTHNPTLQTPNSKLIPIRGDVNGRNFIIYDGKWYGVDFEKYCFGAKEEDAGRLLAFANTYSLSDRKMQEYFVSVLKKSLIDNLRLESARVEYFFENELEAMRLRRNL